MNYLEMLENANVVQKLVEKTIECSKDYTDCKKDDILDQIAEYIAATINNILHDPICHDQTFCGYAEGGGLSFGNFRGKESANAQFFFSREGCHLRLFLSPIGYWWEDKMLTDNGLRCLIKHWPVMKQQMNCAIQAGIRSHNETLSRKLSRQLELHEAVKNFQV
jgi:hypothetical protein